MRQPVLTRLSPHQANSKFVLKTRGVEAAQFDWTIGNNGATNYGYNLAGAYGALAPAAINGWQVNQLQNVTSQTRVVLGFTNTLRNGIESITIRNSIYPNGIRLFWFATNSNFRSNNVPGDSIIAADGTTVDTTIAFTLGGI
jgi:hypothetical protein